MIRRLPSRSSVHYVYSAGVKSESGGTRMGLTFSQDGGGFEPVWCTRG